MAGFLAVCCNQHGREASKAAKVEKEAFSLAQTVKCAEEGLRGHGRLLAASKHRAAEAEKEVLLLRERLEAAREEAVEKAS